MRAIVTHDHTEYRFLLPTTHRRFVHRAAHNFAIDNNEPSIIRGEIRGRIHACGVVLRFGFFPLVTLGLNIDEDLRLLVRPHEHVKNLFACPESDGLPDCWRGDVDLKVGVGEVTANLGELAAVEEMVLAGEEEGGSDEILDGGDDRFAIPGGDEIVLHAHEFKGFGSCFFCLGHI